MPISRRSGENQQRSDELQRKLFGERYVGACLSKILATEDTQTKIVKFLDKKRNFLIYCGSPGIGKTYLSAALLSWALENCRSFRYWNESELLKKVRASMNEFTGDYLETLKYMIDDEFVILDDIGSTGLNEWRREVLFDAIDERYNSMLPTVITSNFSVKEFYQNFHARFASRLFDKENIVIEINDGVDLRQN